MNDESKTQVLRVLDDLCEIHQYFDTTGEEELRDRISKAIKQVELCFPELCSDE